MRCVAGQPGVQHSDHKADEDRAKTQGCGLVVVRGVRRLRLVLSSRSQPPTPLLPPPTPSVPVCSTELPPFALKAGAGREVEQLDTSLNSLLTRLAEHRRRRTFLLAFAQSPADFVQAMVAAQVGAG